MTPTQVDSLLIFNEVKKEAHQFPYTNLNQSMYVLLQSKCIVFTYLFK